MSEIHTETTDKLGIVYEESLTRIVEYARTFPEIWSANPRLEIELIHSLVDEDETLMVFLKQSNGEYGFSGNDNFTPKKGEILNPRDTARELRRMYKGIDFKAEEWEREAYLQIKKHLGVYLAEKETVRRLGKH